PRPRATMPLNPWTGWPAKGGVRPLIGSVPSAVPEASLSGTKVAAGSEANPVRVARPGLAAAAGAARPAISVATPRASSARFISGKLESPVEPAPNGRSPADELAAPG